MLPKGVKKCYLRRPTTPPEPTKEGKQMRYDARGHRRFAPNNAAFVPPLVLRTRPPWLKKNSAKISGQKNHPFGSLREHVLGQFELPSV
jgi:hypothetical protein